MYSLHADNLILSHTSQHLARKVQDIEEYDAKRAHAPIQGVDVVLLAVVRERVGSPGRGDSERAGGSQREEGEGEEEKGGRGRGGRKKLAAGSGSNPG